MDIHQFWSIIEKIKDNQEPEVNLQKELLKVSPEEIVSYQNHFNNLFHAAYRWDLWGAAYIMEGGCSDDGFTDFRYALISKGQKVFEEALQNADSLVDVDIISNEFFGYAALKAYEEKTGREFPKLQSNKYPRKPAGQDWNFDDASENQCRLPRIWKRYGKP